MFTVIKRFLGALFGHKRVEPPPAPPDPYAYRTVPRTRGPYDRNGAVAVLEPDEGERADTYRLEPANKY